MVWAVLDEQLVRIKGTPPPLSLRTHTPTHHPPCLTFFLHLYLPIVMTKGKHGKYWLNEREKILLFWAKTVMESGPDEDVAITSIPAFANNR